MKKNIRNALITLALGKSPARTMKRTAATAVLCIIVFRFLLIPARLHGTSMEPAYRNNSFNFINTLAYIRKEPVRGDVVGIRLAGRRVMLLKRIIGLPGENLEFRGGQLFINGEPFPEPYLKTESDWDMPGAEIGPDEYFAAGDNRSMPIENHELGRVRRERITGKAVF
jgi:signal peptidase I